MKTSRCDVSRLLWAAGIVWLFLMAGAPGVLAHSTQGRIKVPLEKEMVTVDDAAYFIEAYVYRHLYTDKTSGTKDRFFVREFLGLEQDGQTAVVHFMVLDKKTNAAFADKIEIRRAENGVWHYQPPEGVAPIEIYTYVLKGHYYREKYGVLIIIASAALLFALLVTAVYLKKRAKTNLRSFEEKYLRGSEKQEPVDDGESAAPYVA
jgi:uncharacterized protein YsxB (DUF464 family)